MFAHRIELHREVWQRTRCERCASFSETQTRSNHNINEKKKALFISDVKYESWRCLHVGRHSKREISLRFCGVMRPTCTIRCRQFCFCRFRTCDLGHSINDVAGEIGLCLRSVSRRVSSNRQSMCLFRESLWT